MSKKGRPAGAGSRSPSEWAASFRDRPQLSGSSSGEFTLVLVNQVAGAISTGTGTAPDMIEVLQEAAFDGLRGVAPTDAVEGMLAAQMVAVHNAAMDCFRRAASSDQTVEGRRLNLDLANRLVRSYAALVEALGRHRGKGQQVVRVEHVHVHAGAQAVVGAVVPRGVGVGGVTEDRAHAVQLAHAPEPLLRGTDAKRETVQVSSGGRAIAV